MADPMAQLTDLVTDLTGVVREVKEGFTNLAKDVKEVKNDVKALKNGFGATIAATPLATLLHRDMQIVDDTATLRDAIVGVRGSGSGTFSFMKRTDKDGKRTDKDGKKIIEYLVVTCAHCCLEYKMSGKMQFVTIPKELAGMVEGVYILKEYYSFGASYKKNRKHDIILLKLSKFPKDVDLDKVPSWEEEVHNASKQKTFQGFDVAGESLKSPIVGRRVVFDKESGVWRFMPSSNPEPGHSGTLMIGFSSKKVSGYIMSGETTHEPRVLGVYTGLSEFQDNKLNPRGIICPIAAAKDFEYFSRVKIESGKHVCLIEQNQEGAMYTVTEKYDETNEIQSLAADSGICGIFIEAPYTSQNHIQTIASTSMPREQPDTVCCFM